MTSPRSIVILFASGLLAGAAARAHADEPQADPDDDEPTGRFELGAGFSSDDGFVARAVVAQDDLFDSGQRLALSAELTARWQAFRLEHGADDVLGSGLDLRTELFSERRAYHGFSRAGTGGALELGRQLDGATRAYLRYRVEHVDVDVDEVAGAAARAVGSPPGGMLGDGLMATLRAGLVHDTLDAPTLPRHGHRLELFAETADRRLGSEHELTRVGAAVDLARPIGPLTLRVQGRGTYVQGRDPWGVPLSERLQHDGHAEVRGYPLGTLDSTVFTRDGVVAAGDNLEAIGRVELELPVWRRAGISVAGFADAGVRASTDSAWGATDPRLYRSVGASLIWRSPIGPLRLDVALPLDSADGKPQLLFSVGGDF